MGAVTAAVIGAGTALYSANRQAKAQKDAAKMATAQTAAADPYAQYRPEAAQRLNELVNDPSKITESAAYKARMQAAERTLAAQGYTGSGNAVIGAQEAAAAAYQQEIDNLSNLAGVGAGQNAAVAASGNAVSATQSRGDSQAANIGAIGGSLANLVSAWGNRPNYTVRPETITPVNYGVSVPNVPITTPGVF